MVGWEDKDSWALFLTLLFMENSDGESDASGVGDGDVKSQ